MCLLPEKEKSTSGDEDSDNDDHDDPYGKFSSYELAALKKQEENLHRIKKNVSSIYIVLCV